MKFSFASSPIYTRINRLHPENKIKLPVRKTKFHTGICHVSRSNTRRLCLQERCQYADLQSDQDQPLADYGNNHLAACWHR